MASDGAGIRVAFIDDDSGMITVLERRLAALGWKREVLAASVGPDQLTALRLHALIVNPALTGLEFVERVGAAMPGLALIVCSGPASVADRVRALRGGADDWMAKPVHPDELVATVQAVLRRRRVGELPLNSTRVAAGELEIRPDLFDAYVRGHRAFLSRKEFELLRQLASADGRVLEREEIYQRVWGYTMARGDRSVDVFVRKLRQKLEKVSPDWSYVHTHFGVGYRFAAEPVDAAADAAQAAPAGTAEAAALPARSGGDEAGPPSAGSGGSGADAEPPELDLVTFRH